MCRIRILLITRNGHKKALQTLICKAFVEHRGVEPLTSTMRMSRATNCANAPFGKFSDQILQWSHWSEFVTIGDALSDPCPTNCANAPFGNISDHFFHHPHWSGM